MPQTPQGSSSRSAPTLSLASGTACCLTKALLLLSGHFYLSGSRARWRLADSRWGWSTGSQVGGAVPAFLGTGNSLGPKDGSKTSPSIKYFCLILLHCNTWEKGCGESPSYVEWQQATKRKTEIFANLFQTVNALVILASWLFQAATGTTWLGNVLCQPCASQGENFN